MSEKKIKNGKGPYFTLVTCNNHNLTDKPEVVGALIYPPSPPQPPLSKTGVLLVVRLTFESVNEILWCEYSNESY